MSEGREERARQRRIETGRELEARGHLDRAVTQFLRAGAPAEAARALAKVGRLADAGDAILKGLSIEGDDVAGLSADDRAMVAQAAAFFEAAQRGARAQALKAALAAAPPGPAGTPSRARATVSSAPPAPASRAPVASAASAEPAPASHPEAPRAPAPASAPPGAGSFRPPSAPSDGAFRAPGGGSPSFRPPSGAPGSFRPPSGASPSFRPPSAPGSSPPAAGSSAPPVTGPATPPRTSRASEATRKALEPPADAAPVPVVVGAPPRLPAAAEKALGLESGSFHAPRVTPVEAPRASRATPAPALGASGEAITDRSSSRAAGWRDADDDAVERSIQDHLAAGRKGAAARVARDAGQIGRALAWFEELGLHAQAGACLRQLGRPADALTELLRVETTGPGYRKACFEVVALAGELGRLSFDVDRFLAGFVSAGPADRDEIPAYMELARLYVATGFAGGAKRCLREVLELDPEHAEARALEVQLRKERRSRQSPSPRVTGASAGARGLPPLPTLAEFVALAKKHAPEP